MTMSMTGFGRSVTDGPYGRIVIEIQSVNRKVFEMTFSLPREMGRYEIEIRKWISEKILRGQVAIKIQWTPSPEWLQAAIPNPEILQKTKRDCEAACKILQLDTAHITLPFLVSLSQGAQKNEEFHELAALKLGIQESLKALLQMRSVEGKNLAAEIRKRLALIRTMLQEVATLAPEFAGRMRQRLEEKIAPAKQGDIAWDERLAREVALFAEKADIAEEIERMTSHFAQFEHCFSETGAVGKKMDFVIQEMAREINTIGSKSSESKISYLVVEMKTELEKIREQVQNIE
jgi:uncharacterized protein (TIGR00255 family)